MSTTTLVSVQEYLHEIYRPDREYVDGMLLKREMGEKEHSAWQLAIGSFFRAHRLDWNLQVYVELRLAISPTRYRVPDIMILRRDAPEEQIITHPSAYLH